MPGFGPTVDATTRKRDRHDDHDRFTTNPLTPGKPAESTDGSRRGPIGRIIVGSLATGLLGAVSGIAAGVLVREAVTTWAGWQLIFWINVPVGAAALIVALKILPKDRAAPASATQSDLPRSPDCHRRPHSPDVRLSLY
jgi:MFS family permease